MKPRFTRLQFSLRMLLLLMVFVSVGLTIYRWPWEVKGGPSKSKPQEFASRTITYRRNWRGKPEQHGVERWFDAQRRQIAERLYADDQLVRIRRFDEAGELLQQVVFFPHLKQTHSTSYERWSGESIHLKERTVSMRGVDLREWTTPKGKVLESCGFDFQRISHWQKQPVNVAFDRFLAEVSDPVTRSGWQFIPKFDEIRELEELGDGTYRQFINQSRIAPHSGLLLNDVNVAEIVVHFARSDPSFDRDLSRSHLLTSNRWSDVPKDADVNVLHWFLNESLMQIPSFTLCVRFGVVCVVPITERELLPNGDPTDMTSVKFAPDSQQAQDWEQPMVGVSPEIRDHQQRIKQLFAGTSIEVDASRVSGQNEEMPRLQPYAPMTYRRPRRDVFGIFLSYNNYRVEQRGQKLIVLPRDQ